ncbi:MAG: hypothetical protein V2J19_05485 [Wenzhouxiangella sp.]|jgi:hypothetical protein|nr:hypothetical protein [Wenzhouxiangella sp.]
MSLDALIERADEIFAVWGKEITYRVTPMSGPSYDPTPGTPVDYTVNSAPPVEYAQESVGDVGGTQIQLHDLRVSIAASGLPVVPHVGDGDENTALIFDGKVYSIISVMPKFYGEDVGHYDLQVRL